uniref:CCHC-type domain-containing protein n=1 Tax=Amphiprion ocellaris TaxID=80972 RepID=A0A3Q1CJ56_AMPOC
MDAVEIEAWCKRKQLAFENALVLSNITSDVTDDILLRALSQVKTFGKSKIIDRCLDTASKTQFVLIWTSTDLTKQNLPDCVGLPGETGPWPVHVLPVSRREEEFKDKLLSFLKQEGKTVADVRGFLEPSALDVNTALINALSSLVDKCNIAPVDTHGYRKLRMFSGAKPTPSGEEEYDAWAEQTMHLLEEWQCGDTVKKQRIVESLKGPAADIVRFLRTQNPTATSYDYMQALEVAFGTTESASDLLVRFRHTFQNDGEKLSSYLLRLDKLLHCVFRKGGVKISEMDQLRIDQIVKGALPSDMIALRIRMTHKLRAPPTFSELLKEVREEEDVLQSRNDVKSTVVSNTVSVPRPNLDAKGNSEVEQLRKDISVMKAEMVNLKAATVRTQLDTHRPQAEIPAKEKFRRSDQSQRSRLDEDKPVIFCYKCGEDGHFKRDCDGEENLKRVNNRLIKLTKKAGNYRGTQ